MSTDGYGYSYINSIGSFERKKKIQSYYYYYLRERIEIIKISISIQNTGWKAERKRYIEKSTLST